MNQLGTSDATEPAIEIADLSLAFGDTKVLEDVSLKIPAGELVALIGPNGSGKTTLLRCITGLVEPDRGTIRIFGKTSLSEIYSRIGYVPQKLNLDRSFVMSVREFLSLRLDSTRHWFWVRRDSTRRRLGAVIDELNLGGILERPVAHLSGGQLQRVLVAFSLLTDPELLLLDEPTAGVDAPGEQTFYELISRIHANHNMTTVLVSHDLSMVHRHASRVYALNRTICCEGAPEEIMNAESLKRAYGIHVTPYHHHHHAH